MAIHNTSYDAANTAVRVVTREVRIKKVSIYPGRNTLKPCVKGIVIWAVLMKEKKEF